MTKILHFLGMLVIGGMAGGFVTGCLSSKILEERSDHGPAPDPRVELRLKSEKPADVLVLYDEQKRQTGKVTRRAFYLFSNEEPLGNGKRPKFVNPERTGAHIPIQVLKATPSAANSIPEDLYAISSSPSAFKLESRGRILAEFELPEYGNWLTAKKFFLFPLAAAGDAVGAGAAVTVDSLDSVLPAIVPAR